MSAPRHKESTVIRSLHNSFRWVLYDSTSPCVSYAHALMKPPILYAIDVTKRALFMKAKQAITTYKRLFPRPPGLRIVLPGRHQRTSEQLKTNIKEGQAVS